MRGPLPQAIRQDGDDKRCLSSGRFFDGSIDNSELTGGEGVLVEFQKMGEEQRDIVHRLHLQHA